MATLNGRGGWDLTDDDVAEIVAASFPDAVPALTLAEFLTARITDDEAVARAATLGPWEAWSGASAGGGEYVTSRARFGGGYTFGISPGVTGEAGFRLAGRDAAHIARFNPARVVAECAAKRRIVEGHSMCGSGIGSCDDGGHAIERDEPGGPGCETLFILASVYTEHPDFHPEWRQ